MFSSGLFDISQLLFYIHVQLTHFKSFSSSTICNICKIIIKSSESSEENKTANILQFPKRFIINAFIKMCGCTYFFYYGNSQAIRRNEMRRKNKWKFYCNVFNHHFLPFFSISLFPAGVLFYIWISISNFQACLIKTNRCKKSHSLITMLVIISNKNGK